MSKFIIRPEINNAKEGDYDLLHQEMYKRKIYKVVKGANNRWYDLPTGTYLMEFNGTALEVLDICSYALNCMGKHNTYRQRDFEIIVADYNSAALNLTLNKDISKLPFGARLTSYTK